MTSLLSTHLPQLPRLGVESDGVGRLPDVEEVGVGADVERESGGDLRATLRVAARGSCELGIQLNETIEVGVDRG